MRGEKKKLNKRSDSFLFGKGGKGEGKEVMEGRRVRPIIHWEGRRRGKTKRRRVGKTREVVKKKTNKIPDSLFIGRREEKEGGEF